MMQRIAALIFSVALVMGCNESKDSTSDTSQTKTMTFDINKYAMNKVVCDPLEGGDPTNDPGQGIKAELYYLESGSCNNVQTYFENGIKLDSDLFFSNLYVPTRLFNLGFPKETGGVLEDNDGNALIEYFALKMETTLKLGPDQQAGYYEFAVLSDDGTVINYRDLDGEMKTLIDNDGNHPTKMGCSGSVIKYFDQNTRLPIEIFYYQGPKYHISIVPLMRRIDDEEGQQPESQCGKKGNNMYFAFNNNSAPQQTYLNLLLRGWEPLNSSNYVITTDDPTISVDFNPCVAGTPPSISNLLIEGFPTDSGISAFWKTDIPAASQLLITNVNTGEETLTTSDNVLRTNHSFFIQVESNATYEVRAISVSEDLGKTVSDPVTVEL